MFIFWGTQTVYRKLGHVADFCPICRSQQAFVLRRIGSAGHLYFISLGQGKLIGHDITCQNCHTTFEADPSLYSDVAKQRPFSLVQLAQQTFPDYSSIHAERLEMERAIRFNPFGLRAPERHRLLREPFLLLSPQLEQRASFFRLDWPNALTLLTLVFAPILLLPLRPNQHEITTVLHELSKQGFRIGKKIKASTLMQALRDAQLHPGNIAQQQAKLG